MVFHFRCFSCSFEDGENIEYDTRTQTNSSWTGTFHTAFSSFNSFIPNFLAKTSEFSSLAEKPSNLRVFTLAELNAATNDFSKNLKIGEGGFAKVYRGVIKSLEHPFGETQVAVKYAKGVLTEYTQWVNEINVLGVVKHPNLVKLVGYCIEDNGTGTQLLLVYEYMPNRSVRDCLSRSSKSLLPWKERLKVAQDAARGLAYLHEEMDLEIIFRDFKSSNVLLDDQWNAKLSDFGLGPQDGRTHVTISNFTETIGYAAPEYISIGHLSSKSDVWSYGIFLYELITGRHPLDKNGPRHEELLEWVNPQINAKKFITIIDSRLEGKYSFKSAQKLSIIASSCLSSDPKSRPKMSEVLEMINQLIGVPTTATMPMKVSAGTTHEKKTNKNTKHKDEEGSINIQLNKPTCLPQIFPSRLLKYCFKKECCCVS